MPKITRAEALRRGLDHYFTGKPCEHGHVAPRRVFGYTCIECERLQPKAAPTEESKKLARRKVRRMAGWLADDLSNPPYVRPEHRGHMRAELDEETAQRRLRDAEIRAITDKTDAEIGRMFGITKQRVGEIKRTKPN